MLDGVSKVEGSPGRCHMDVGEVLSFANAFSHAVIARERT
jgi:hypothetical protein